MRRLHKIINDELHKIILSSMNFYTEKRPGCVKVSLSGDDRLPDGDYWIPAEKVAEIIKIENSRRQVPSDGGIFLSGEEIQEI